jgi:hypothetical protein
MFYYLYGICLTPFGFLPHPDAQNNTQLTHAPLSNSKVGSEPLRALTDTIWHAVGPSGPNKVRSRGRASHFPCTHPAPGACHLTLPVTRHRQDYVYKLAASVRELAPEAHDSHLFALEVCIRTRIAPNLHIRKAIKPESMITTC